MIDQERCAFIPVSLAQLVGILHIICKGWGSNPDTPFLHN